MAHDLMRGTIAVVVAMLILAAGVAVLVSAAAGQHGARNIDYRPSPSVHVTRHLG